MSIYAGFTCRKCDYHTVDVLVRERKEKENIVDYVKYVAGVCGERHGIVSPLCSERKIDLMVPMTRNGIGKDGPEMTDEQKKQLGGKSNV